MRRVVALATAAASALLLALIAWKLRGPRVLLLLGAALASAAQVVIDALEARGLKRGAALALTYGAALVLLVGAVLGLSGSLLVDLRASAEGLGRTYERLSGRLPQGGALAQLMAANLPPPRQLVAEWTRSDPGSLAGDALATSGWLLERLSAVLIVLILALHWSAAGDRLTRFALVLIPAHRRAWSRLVLADVGQAVGRQLAGGLMKGYLALLVFAVGFRALGVPFPTLLAVIVAALAVVPLVGVLLGPALVLAVSWKLGPGVALSAALATAALMLILDRVLARRLLDARRSNPVLEIVVLLVLARAVGPLGLLAAPAVAAILHIVVEQLALSRTVLRTNTIEGMRQRLEELRQQELLPELDSVASSLGTIADQASELSRRPMIEPVPGGPSTGGPSGELPRQPPGLVPPITVAG